MHNHNDEHYSYPSIHSLSLSYPHQYPPLSSIHPQSIHLTIHIRPPPTQFIQNFDHISLNFAVRIPSFSADGSTFGWIKRSRIDESIQDIIRYRCTRPCFRVCPMWVSYRYLFQRQQLRDQRTGGGCCNMPWQVWQFPSSSPSAAWPLQVAQVWWSKLSTIAALAARYGIYRNVRRSLDIRFVAYLPT